MESGGRVSGAILSRLGGVPSAVEELWSVTAPGRAGFYGLTPRVWGTQAASTGIIFAVPGPDAEPIASQFVFLHCHPSFLFSWGSA